MDRKKRILNAAIELFAERGFAGTPTSAIAKKADVAEGLIFHYFKNKTDILASTLKQLFNGYIKEYDKLIQQAPTGMEAILSTIRFHFAFASIYSKEIKVLLRDFSAEVAKPDSDVGRILTEQISRTIDLMKKAIEKGQKDGSIKAFPAMQAAYIIRGMLSGITRQTHQVPDYHEIPDLCASVIDFCKTSLSTESDEDETAE